MQSKDNEALARLEAERDRRVLDKIARGEAVLLPPKVAVIGYPKPMPAAVIERDPQGREIIRGTLREDGTIDPGIATIVTGVPRPGRDTTGEPAAPPAPKSTGKWTCPTCRGSFPDAVTIHRCEPAGPKLPRPAQPAPPVQEEQRRHIWTQVRGATETDPGQIAEGSFSVMDGMVYAWDADGKHLGRLALGPSDDAATVARRLLRDKTSAGGFYAPLPQPPKIYH
jgi:hypothetical protein